MVVLLLYPGVVKKGRLFIVVIVRKQDAKKYNINVNIEHNSIRNIVSKLDIDISNKDYGAIPTTEKNTESR